MFWPDSNTSPHNEHVLFPRSTNGIPIRIAPGLWPYLRNGPLDWNIGTDLNHC
jgi:hypothetical protein